MLKSSTPPPILLEYKRQPVNHDWVQAIVHNRGPMVILNNLPHHVTYTQVMDGVTGLGGVNSVIVMAEPAPFRKDASCAIVHFNYLKAAKTYTDFFTKKPLFFIDKDGDVHKVNMLTYEGATPSLNDSHHKLSGRCLEFNDFHAPAIWAALQKIGLKAIVRVTFNPDTSGDLGELSVELITVAHASRVRSLALDRDLPGFSGIAENLSDGLCESDYHPSHIKQRFNNVIPYIGQDHLEKKWNREPYNTWECHPVEFTQTVAHARYRDFLPEIPEDEGLHPVTPSTNGPRGKGNGDLVIEMGGFLYSCDRGVIHKLSLSHPVKSIEVRGYELQTLVDLTLRDPGWYSFWRDVERQQRNPSPEVYSRMVEHQRLNMEGWIACPEDCKTCHPSLSYSLTPPLRARMYTQTSGEGYVHSDWIRLEDEQTRHSIRPMTPQMGQILRPN